MHAVAMAWSLGSALAMTLMRVVVIAAPPPKAPRQRPIVTPQEESKTRPEQKKRVTVPRILTAMQEIVSQ